MPVLPKYTIPTLDLFELDYQGSFIVLIKINEKVISSDTLRTLNQWLNSVMKEYNQNQRKDWRLVLDFTEISLPGIGILKELPEFNDTMKLGTAAKVGITIKNIPFARGAILSFVTKNGTKSPTDVFYFVNDALKFAAS